MVGFDAVVVGVGGRVDEAVAGGDVVDKPDDKAKMTSAETTRPAGPVPCMLERAVGGRPASLSSFRARGEANTFEPVAAEEIEGEGVEGVETMGVGAVGVGVVGGVGVILVASPAWT